MPLARTTVRMRVGSSSRSRPGGQQRSRATPNHPVTRGFLCAKVAKYLDRVYSPGRVLYPMRRVAPKGAGSKDASDFQRISWDEALREIADRFRNIATEFGPEAILPYSYGGTLATLSGAPWTGASSIGWALRNWSAAICSAAGEAGLKSVIGVKLGTEPEQFRHSRYIIAWGANIHGNNVHLWPFIEEARRDGAKLVVIDPTARAPRSAPTGICPSIPARTRPSRSA